MHPDVRSTFILAITQRLLAAFVALTFLAALLPAGAFAAQSIMACCRGKSASHCHAGFKPTRTTSIGSSCCLDCCTYCSPAQQTRRERNAPQPVVKLVSPPVVSSPVVTINADAVPREDCVSLNPRGPPACFVA